MNKNELLKLADRLLDCADDRNWYIDWENMECLFCRRPVFEGEPDHMQNCWLSRMREWRRQYAELEKDGQD
jgi:hypothetical protein